MNKIKKNKLNWIRSLNILLLYFEFDIRVMYFQIICFQIVGRESVVQ